MPRISFDLCGRRFGRLTVMRRGEKLPHTSTWDCLCDCGGKTNVRRGNLLNGSTKSCGCIVQETNIILRSTHGMHGTPTYRVWVSMKSRCINKNHQHYRDYGGRGIKVCDRWMTFENFLEDMGEKPDELSIDRIDNNGHYEKDNCRWASITEQASNRRDSRHSVYIDGTRIPLAEACRKEKIRYGTALARKKRGWLDSDLLKPVEAP